jgi:hypothetical protein
MSGETEASVSGWTVDTLREHIDQRTEDLRDGVRQQITDMRVMLNERYETQTKALDAAFKAAEQAVQTALVSAEKAVGKAEAAADKRFDAVNEFRQTLSDQTATFIPRSEYDAAQKALTERVAVNSDRVAALELRLTSRLDRGEGSDAGAAGQRTDQRLNISQVIAALGFLAAVITLILYVTKK